MNGSDDNASVAIRPAQESDLQACRVIEDSAGEIFIEIGMTEINDDPPRNLEDLRAALDREDLWVACDANDVPVAFALANTFERSLHVAEIDVLRHWQRQGIGRRLIDHLAVTAATRGMEALTLTTFRDVPWNAPYYERLGFAVLPEAQWGPELTALVTAEEHHGLDRRSRVVMRRPL